MPPLRSLDEPPRFGFNARLHATSSAFAGHSGRVAQLVEQGIENPRVGGSIPSPATMFSKARFARSGLSFCLRRGAQPSPHIVTCEQKTHEARARDFVRVRGDRSSPDCECDAPADKIENRERKPAWPRARFDYLSISPSPPTKPGKNRRHFRAGNMAEQLPEAMKNQRVFSGIVIFSCRRTGIAVDGLSIYSAGPKAPSIAPGVDFFAQAVVQTRCA